MPTGKVDKFWKERSYFRRMQQIFGCSPTHISDATYTHLSSDLIIGILRNVAKTFFCVIKMGGNGTLRFVVGENDKMNKSGR